MNSRILQGLGAGLLLALTSGSALAQVPLTPRALGMGGAYLGTARGHEALFLNPANLGLPGTPRWSIALPQIAAAGTILGPDLADLPDLLEATDEDTGGRGAEILATIPESGTEARYDVRAPLVALQIGRLALGVAYGSLGQHSFSKDIVELLVDGYEENRTDYSVGNTAGSRRTYWDFAAGYGRRFGPLSLGVTGHYLRAGSAVRSRMFEPKIDVEARDITVNYVSVLAKGGSGYSVDVGAALQPLPSVTVSAAVANLASDLKWSEDLRVRDFRLSRNDIDAVGFWDLKLRYEGTEKPLDPTSASLRAIDTAQGLYEEAFLPAEARLGVDWSPVGGTHLGVAYQSHLTEGQLGGRWERQASVGVQQKLPLITVRAGFATNLDEGSLVSGGLSLGPLQLGIAKLTDGQTDGASRSGWMATFGLGVATPQTLQ